MSAVLPKIIVAINCARRTIFADPNRSGTAKIVAAVLLLDFTNNAQFEATGELVAWPSQRRLAKATAMTARSIRRAVFELVSAGILDVAPGGGTETTAYGFRSDWLATVDGQDHGQECFPFRECPRGVDTAGSSPMDSDVLRLFEQTDSNYPSDSHSACEPSPGGSPADVDQDTAARPPAPGRRETKKSSKAHSSVPTTPAPDKAKGAKRSRMMEDEFERFEPDAADHAWISEHCAAVKDPHARSWIEEFINWSLGDKGVPRDPHYAFRGFMQRRQKWALEARAKGQQHLTARADRSRNGTSAAMNELTKMRSERLEKDQGHE